MYRLSSQHLTQTSNTSLFWPFSSVTFPPQYHHSILPCVLSSPRPLFKLSPVFGLPPLSCSFLLFKAFLLPQAQFRSFPVQEAFSDFPREMNLSLSQAPLALGASHNFCHSFPSFRFTYVGVSGQNLDYRIS